MPTETNTPPERTYTVIENASLPVGQVLFLNGRFIVRSFKDLDIAMEIDLARQFNIGFVAGNTSSVQAN